MIVIIILAVFEAFVSTMLIIPELLRNVWWRPLVGVLHIIAICVLLSVSILYVIDASKHPPQPHYQLLTTDSVYIKTN